MRGTDVVCRSGASPFGRARAKRGSHDSSAAKLSLGRVPRPPVAGDRGEASAWVPSARPATRTTLTWQRDPPHPTDGRVPRTRLRRCRVRRRPPRHGEALGDRAELLPAGDLRGAPSARRRLRHDRRHRGECPWLATADPRRRHHPGARKSRNYERLVAALDDLGVPASVVDSDFRDLDPRDAFDLARATILDLPTAAGDLDVLNGAPGRLAYEDLRERAIEVEVRGRRSGSSRSMT